MFKEQADVEKDLKIKFKNKFKNTLAPNIADAQNLYSSWDPMKNICLVNILTEIFNLEQ